MSAGTVHVYIVRPDGRTIDSLHVAIASKSDRLIDMMERNIHQLGTQAGKPLVKPAAQSACPQCKNGELALHLTARSLRPGGAVRAYRKFDQRIILDGIEEQLLHEPTTETRNKKRLGPNELSDWELRVEKFRLFYDVLMEAERRIVKIKAVGHKEHNKLFIGGKEIPL